MPFDEDQRNPEVWFLDHSYLENMAAMFRKVNCKNLVNISIKIKCLFLARERIVGWYHTGPKLYRNDMKIHELIGQHCANPV